MEQAKALREKVFLSTNTNSKIKKRSKSHVDEQYVQESTFNEDLNNYNQETKEEIIKKYTNPDKESLLELSEDVTKQIFYDLDQNQTLLNKKLYIVLSEYMKELEEKEKTLQFLQNLKTTSNYVREKRNQLKESIKKKQRRRK